VSPKTEPQLSNQQLRTRKNLLLAAARLLKACGRKPSMDEVAREALVSRATAYRHFPTIESLLVEAPLDDAVPTPQTVFGDDPSVDPLERIDKAESALHDMVYDNEAQLRLMLASSLYRQSSGKAKDKVPVRQNRRGALIEAALGPARDLFEDAAYDRLFKALSLIFGTESMVVFRDVVPISSEEARAVKSWAAKTLVRAAIEESKR
jgi:AcrR family transcriptional regulator